MSVTLTVNLIEEKHAHLKDLKLPYITPTPFVPVNQSLPIANGTEPVANGTEPVNEISDSFFGRFFTKGTSSFKPALPYAGSIVGGLIFGASTVEVIKAVRNNSNRQGIKNTLPKIALIGASALIIGVSQIGASNKTALIISAIAASLVSGTAASISAFRSR